MANFLVDCNKWHSNTGSSMLDNIMAIATVYAMNCQPA